MSSNFDEKSGVIYCKTPWGQWFQTAEEVCVELFAATEIRGKDVSVKITPSYISCTVKGDIIVEGNLFGNVIADESTWSIEDRKLIRILLAKSLRKEAPCWRSLFSDGGCSPDEWTFDQMQRKLTLERYQVEHPGFDFSSADISGNYVTGGHHN